jgi:hypothetical protein
VTQAGLTGVHFHGLRHAGNNLAATTGATLRELMARMGHSTTRAALIYLHNSEERQRKIAEGVDELLRSHLESAGQPSVKPTAGQSGTDLPRGAAATGMPPEDSQGKAP